MQFHTDQDEEYLQIPIICYQVKNQESLIPITEKNDLVFSVMKKYTHSCFSSERELMSYALNKMGVQGTHIFITDLKSGQQEKPDLKMTSDDIVHHHSQQGINQLPLSQSFLIENSLT